LTSIFFVLDEVRMVLRRGRVLEPNPPARGRARATANVPVGRGRGLAQGEIQQPGGRRGGHIEPPPQAQPKEAGKYY
jgi:hypothetical protein